MPISNYPGGFLNGVAIRGIPVLNMYSGSVFWVDSTTGADSGKGTYRSPFATLDYAVGRCTANKGDKIFVMPNHAETYNGVAALALDVAGIDIIGLGNHNNRPRFLMDGTAAATTTALVSAADVSIHNCVFASGYLLTTTCFNITGKGFWANGLEFEDNTTAENWATPFKATGAANTADGLKITNCRWVPLVATVNALEFVEITDNISHLTIEDNFIAHEGTASPLFLQAGTKVMHGAKILRNFLSHKMTAGDLAFNNGGSTNSGIIAHNRIGHADVTSVHEMGAVAGCRFFDNLSVSTDALSGFVLPAIDADS